MRQDQNTHVNAKNAKLKRFDIKDHSLYEPTLVEMNLYGNTAPSNIWYYTTVSLWDNNTDECCFRVARWFLRSDAANCDQNITSKNFFEKYSREWARPLIVSDSSMQQPVNCRLRTRPWQEKQKQIANKFRQYTQREGGGGEYVNANNKINSIYGSIIYYVIIFFRSGQFHQMFQLRFVVT